MILSMLQNKSTYSNICFSFTFSLTSFVVFVPVEIFMSSVKRHKVPNNQNQLVENENNSVPAKICHARNRNFNE